MIRILPQKKAGRLGVVLAKAMLCCTLLLLLSPNASQAQEPGTDPTVTIFQVNVPLKSILDDIEKQTGYVFFYNNQAVNVASKTSINVTNEKLSVVLSKLLGAQGIQYTFMGKQIALAPKSAATETAATATTQTPTATASSAPAGNVTASPGAPQQQAAAGNARVLGKVVDESGLPLPGVSVEIKGTQKLYVTSDKGEYWFTAADARNATLLFSFVGMQSQEVPVPANGQMPLVTMKDEATELSGAMVTGYQTISKERATGAYAIINNQALEKKITFNATSALEGQVAGVTTYGGNIVVRGQSTLSKDIGTNPLVVIDNLPTEQSIDDINVNDIESITVLKDAAATSIYGSRAANGVIVVTTKRGEKGKTQVNFTSDWRWQTNPSLSDYHYAPTSYFIEATEKFWARVAMTPLYGGSVDTYIINTFDKGRGNSITYASPHADLRLQLAKGTISQDTYNAEVNKLKGYDYRKELMDETWRTPFRQSYNISVSNASERQNTYASFNFTDNLFRENTNSTQTMKAYLKTRQTITKWLSVEVGMDALYGKSESTEGGGTFESQASFLEPYTRIYNDNGELDYKPYISTAMNTSWFGNSINASYNPRLVADMSVIKGFVSPAYNILEERARNTVDSKNLNLRSFAQLNVDIYQGLKFSSNFSYELNDYKEDKYFAADSYYLRSLSNRLLSGTVASPTANIPAGAHLQKNNTSGHSYTFRNQLDYNVTIKDKHAISVLAGMEMRETEVDPKLINYYWGYNPQTLITSTPSSFNSYGLYNTGVTSLMYNSTQYLPAGVIPGTASLGTNPVNHFLSFYGAGGYTYKGLYSLSGSVRVDQTNLFGTDPKYRYRPLWSVGAVWNISRENFMSATRSWLDMLSIRGSYGVTGNVDTGSSPYIRIKNGTNSFIALDPLEYTELSGTPNPSLRWEKTSSYALGFDFSVFKGLLAGKVEGYYKYSDDLLALASLPVSSGYSSSTVNNGALSNKGVEVTLNSPWFNKGGWKLSSGLLFGYNYNKIEKSNRKPTSAGNLVMSYSSYYQEGKPYAALYAYRNAGITTNGTDAQNGTPITVDQNGIPLYTISPTGTYAATSATVSPDAVRYMGSLVPLWNGSFTQSASYKGFELTAMFTFYGGHKMRKPTYNFAGVNGSGTSGMGTISSDVLNAWSPTNPNSQIARPNVDYPYGATGASIYIVDYWRYADVHVVNADMLRFKNLALSYTLDNKYAKAIYLQKVRLTAQINDLCFWSAAGSDIDPEAYGQNSVDWTIPVKPSYLLRLEITF